TRFSRDWSSDVCSSDLNRVLDIEHPTHLVADCRAIIHRYAVFTVDEDTQDGTAALDVIQAPELEAHGLNDRRQQRLEVVRSARHSFPTPQIKNGRTAHLFVQVCCCKPA